MNKSTCHILNFLEKVLILKEKLYKGLNLIVRLNEEEILIESFFLHRISKGGTEYLNFWGGEELITETQIYNLYMINNINNGFHLDPNFSMKQFAKK